VALLLIFLIGVVVYFAIDFLFELLQNKKKRK
jgi:hypothetical protein